jgi:RND superfamily putative drug exporter
LARTAGLITSAAAIMIVVFAAFTFGNFLIVKMIGFTLAVAVFIDATLVRIVIGPALLRIAGDWNWWPGLKTKEIAPEGWLRGLFSFLFKSSRLEIGNMHAIFPLLSVT